jgi:type IV pilus assembly protein PilO
MITLGKLSGLGLKLGKKDKTPKPKDEKSEKGAAKTAPAPKLDFNALADQFRGLDPNQPGDWPLLPRLSVLIGIFAGVIGAAWYLSWSPFEDEIARAKGQENTLRQEWLSKKRQAVNLEAHKKQLDEIDRQFGTLLRQLPNKAEMDALLADINQAGVGRGLQFELFKPGSENTREFYAEMPIAIRLLGTYDDLGAFVADVAKMPRIVTINNLALESVETGGLKMDASAVTYRYLEAGETGSSM